MLQSNKFEPEWIKNVPDTAHRWQHAASENKTCPGWSGYQKPFATFFVFSLSTSYRRKRHTDIESSCPLKLDSESKISYEHSEHLSKPYMRCVTCEGKSNKRREEKGNEWRSPSRFFTLERKYQHTRMCARETLSHARSCFFLRRLTVAVVNF